MRVRAYSNKAVSWCIADPPLEQHLVQNTLWPETQKLYGHGFELMSLTANHAGTLVVSTCKATSPEHAQLHGTTLMSA